MATDNVKEIKERLSIQDIIAPYVKLTRTGRSLRGLCPFHKEKTPSFHVSLERGSWHCFGCGLGGDGFTFIEKAEGVDFKGALKILAEKAGIKIATAYGTNREEESKKERLRSIMERSSQWYASKIAHSPAESYAKKRGLTEKTISTWRLGYAPEEWRALLDALSSEGYKINELISAGLIKEADGKRGTYYDRFRNRLMFPIRDSAGRVVAFTGRALSEDDVAKYLNSPETELYHKSEILFGVDLAKDAIRARGFAMLVEGQIDVLHAHQAGFENAIALSGTALSEKHIALIKRYSENLMLVLDADQAGLFSAAKSAELALRAGLKVKAVQLPKDKDPADLISEDSKEFAKRIVNAKPIVEHLLIEFAERENNAHKLLHIVERVVLPLIATMTSPMEKEHFMQVTARALNLSIEAVRESLKHLPASNAKKDATFLQSAKSAKCTARELRLKQLFAAVHVYHNMPLAERIRTEYCRITGAELLPLDVPPESALFYAEQTFGENPSEDAANELLRAFEEAVIREAYQVAVMNLRKAESALDPALIDSAQAECTKLSSRLAALGL